MDWKRSLDRYLTHEPINTESDWLEQVYESFSDEFFGRVVDPFENREDPDRGPGMITTYNFFEDHPFVKRWHERLFSRAVWSDYDDDGEGGMIGVSGGDMTPEKEAAIIERAYKRFLLNTDMY